jgi:hypothetical protein
MIGSGTIVGLAAASRTGTIRSQDGSRFAFCAAAVLGDFDALAVGHRVNFDVNPQHNVAVRVFREPVCGSSSRKVAGALPDLRYAGFEQLANVRTYLFDAIAPGDPFQRFAVTVDLALLVKHHVGIQDAPALCLHKLGEDLKTSRDSGPHALVDDDLLAFVSSRAASLERKKPKHSFTGRRGPPPPGPSQNRLVP